MNLSLLSIVTVLISYSLQDIFRKYPQNYEGIIPTLCSNLQDLDEPEAKASLIWILGEYAEKIDNSDELLGLFLDNFLDEQYQVQFQTLTAIVKLFLKRPDGAQGIVQRVLELATKECDNPDLRDRAFVYWRLLSSSDAGAGKSVVLAERPPISIPLTSVPPALLEELVSDLSSLASAYHKPESTFIGRGRLGADALSRKRDEITREKALATVVQGQAAENLLDFGDDDEGASQNQPISAGAAGGLGGLGDLMMDDGGAQSGSVGGGAASAANSAGAGQLSDLLGLFDAAPGSKAPGAQSGLDALSALPAAPSHSPMASTFANGSAPPAAQRQQHSNSGGGDLLDLL